ncbi:hypothetical protein Pyrfu_1226 [Pyrolobus fumarii 1A]|uniref:Uncharacterized protein n=1 Tax=Pyrolobus fumarii (strain DSM 11204 / 1A) TaxID=694429 RepID=G0EFY5_PYRF1|nr:hypothetical protein [Pyrolobus fumarii]AEM39086.1 hypothetical protein Pyrfu_1226 [Pyrolobus fumarii 1A]
MGRVAKVVTSIVVLAVILLGVYGYAVQVAASSLEEGGIQVADVKGLVTGLVGLLKGGSAEFTVYLNVSPRAPLPVMLCIDEVHGVIMLGGEVIGTFRSEHGACVKAGGWELLPIRLNVNGVKLLEALAASSSEEANYIVLRGEAVVPLTLLGAKLPISMVVYFERRVPVGEVVAKAMKPVKSVVESIERKLGIAPGYSGNPIVHIESVEWLCGGVPCGTATEGETVTVVVRLSGYAHDVVVKVRQDRRLLPDKTVAERRIPVLNGTMEVVLRFTVETGLTVRSYFVEVDWPGGKWVMPHEERLRVG